MEEDRTQGPSEWVKFNMVRHWSSIARGATADDIVNDTLKGRLCKACIRYCRDGYDFESLQAAAKEYTIPRAYHACAWYARA